MLPLILNLVTGAVGGNIAGAVMKKFSLGTLGNSLAGILGGGVGGTLLGMAGIGASPSGALDLNAILGSLASGGVGGGAAMAVIGMLKKMLSKS